MNDSSLFIILLISALIVFFLGRRRAQTWQLSATAVKIHSLPMYYGYMVAICTVIPALFLFALWSFFSNNIITGLTISNFLELQQLPSAQLSLAMNEISNLANNTGAPIAPDNLLLSQASKVFIEYKNNNAILKTIVILLIALFGFACTFWRITPNTRARNKVERLIVYVLFGCTLFAIIITLGIVFSVLFESIEFFKKIPITDFLFGTHWSPQIAIRDGQAGSSGAFGAVPLFWGTIFISMIAMFIAGPLGLVSAIYLAEYASPKVRSIVKPILEVLAGVPTVVYGFFAALTVGPLVRDFGLFLRSMGVNLDIELMANISVSTESALAAGLVMGMMIIPFILSLSDDVISAVPDSMRDGSTALGATKSETIWKVIIPSALPGIVGGFLLAISRAIGETMIVLMAAGVAANLSANPMDTVTTITTQIVTLLTGDQEFDSVKTLAAFALGLGLFITTLILNIIALHVVKKYREQYE